MSESPETAVGARRRVDAVMAARIGDDLITGRYVVRDPEKMSLMEQEPSCAAELVAHGLTTERRPPYPASSHSYTRARSTTDGTSKQ